MTLVVLKCLGLVWGVVVSLKACDYARDHWS